MNTIAKKPIIAMDLSTQGKGGGPYTSTNRIMNSSLSAQYSFKVIHYNPAIGKGLSLKRVVNLRNQIKQIKPDIVHFTGLSLQGIHLAVACLLAGVDKKIVTIRGTSTDAIDFHPAKRFILANILEPLTLLLATKIVGVSNYVSTEKVAKKFKPKLFGTIYNFPPKVAARIPFVDYRKKLGFSNENIVISSVGRITKEKGYHILERAILKFSASANIKFVIAGNGDYLKTMKTNLGDQVTSGQVVFLGYCEATQQLNDCADIFVLPTLHETLSNALLEASTSSLALIASDTGGVPEIVESGVNGELVPVGDANAIVKAILKLADNPKLRLKYGRNALKKVNEKFSSKTIEHKLSSLYEQLLTGK